MKTIMKTFWINPTIIGLILFLATTTCKKEEKPTLPILTTTSLSSITATSSIGGGNISSDGNATITDRGVCWSPTVNPSVSISTKTSDGTGSGSFTSNLTGLSAGSTYHVRAFATNEVGTAYGNDVTFKTSAILPSLTTTIASSISSTTANSGGNITSDGGAAITSRGVCWGIEANPTIALSTKTADGSGIGAFTSALTDLTPGTTYHLRAYATNSVGTTYGEDLTFKTISTVPVLTTTPTSLVTSNTASSGGNITSDGGSVITGRGVCWGVSLNPTIALNTKTNDGTGNGIFTSSITGLTAGATYHVRAYATNSVGTSYGIDISFTTSISTPVVITTSVTSVTSGTASSGGNVTSDGGANVSSKGICWSTNPNPTISDSKTNDGTGQGIFTSTISGLTPGTKYYARAYAINSVGISYGNEISFTTLSIPILNTSAMSAITQNTATSGGNVINDGGSSVSARGVCWSISQGPTISNNKTIDGSGSGTFTSNLTGLQSNTTYYVRAYATNNIGTAYGDQITFTTKPIVVPILTTTTASNINYTSATSGGEVTNDGGGTVTSRGVCWSTTQDPTINNSKTTNGAGLGVFTSSITNLQSNTLYYVRAYATNSSGTGYGDQIIFTTLQTVVPTVTTTSASNISYTTASGGGNVTDDGGNSVTARGVCWSTTQYPTISSNKTTDGVGLGTFTSSLTGLTPNTTYYFRAYATNTTGTGYGNQLTFTLQAQTPPVVTIVSVSGITETSASCSGNVIADGGLTVTSRGFCWNTTGNPVTSNSKVTVGAGTGSFSGNLTSLSAKTKYYVRAFATNSMGTSYSDEATFTTLEFLNAPKWLFYDDGVPEFDLYTMAANNQAILRFEKPSGWGNISIKKVQVYFGSNSTYYVPTLDIVCYTTYYTASNNAVSPTGSGSTIFSGGTGVTNTTKEFAVAKTISTDYFFISVKSTNSYNLHLKADVRTPGATNLSTILWGADGTMTWVDDSYMMFRVYIEDIYGKGMWVESNTNDVDAKTINEGNVIPVTNITTISGFSGNK